jgi:hypothetical protein
MLLLVLKKELRASYNKDVLLKTAALAPIATEILLIFSLKSKRLK